MQPSNIVLLRGRVAGEPRHRELPSGSRVVELSVAAEPGSSVPVVVHDRDPGVTAGDEVVVAGKVVRRFFRAGGVTQSRTEVVAERLVPARATRSVRSLERVVTDAITG